MKNNLLVLFSLSLMIPTSFAARCADFSNQQEAQSYMQQTGARNLDRDRDGEACECLPGGSKYGTSVCR
ncbi:excalibur calcium-binding domain-containing protein [Actinobacillus genomosp. 2]|uniref:excalibur calcium-binding domain-containing protein n=1 Tax=Actinobacillus genomosp. 2 TaxID=230709 RepID=UPI0024430E82|nr:excalibur calcium-binding domain-containing protein [Actinobacillus genomosp. 2]WGE32770.1 excalibur calcium-binding domain-containing protein [Actinobacillus genomosp. 2]